MSNTFVCLCAQRKRRTVGSLLVSGSPKPRGHASTNRAAHSNRRANGGRRSRPQERWVLGAAAAAAAAAAETVNVMDNVEDDDGVEEVVDLTSEAAEASTHVVDLTNNDSVLLVDEGHRRRRSNLRESYVVSSSDDDDSTSVPSANTLTSIQTHSSNRLTPGTISCPVCMDTYSEMVSSGRLVVSTKCGHVFCSQCLRDALRRSHSCPTCRKRLTSRQYHPLYI
ncbi:E3 ubiquitin-protein ligase RNF4-like isoform X3 [Festucalex cinctus]